MIPQENTELEILRKQVREMRSRIQELEKENEGCFISAGNVKLEREVYGTQKITRWYIAVNFDFRRICGAHYCRPTSWRKIIDGNSRKEVVEQIPNLIKSLQQIYEQAGGANDDSARTESV